MSDARITHSEITADDQARHLESATVAGLRGDVAGMLEALVRSKLLDGLKHQLHGNERGESSPADADLIDMAIGRGTDAAFAQLSKGNRPNSLAAYINRVTQTSLT
ncbi:MAG: hypothetical protein AAGD43_22500 [Pseudomonadota bacterium]